MANHIFISYNRKDYSYCQKLKDSIEKYGLDVWIDEKIDISDEWWEVIIQKIKTCSAFIVIMSDNSRPSKWVRRECAIADDQSKPIFPLLLNGKSFELFIDIQFIDVTNEQLPPLSFYQKLQMTVLPSRDQEINKAPNLSSEFSQENGSFLELLRKILDEPKGKNDTFPKLTKESGIKVNSIPKKDEISKINNKNENFYDLRARIIENARTVNPEGKTLCPICGISIINRNLIRHYDKHVSKIDKTKLYSPINTPVSRNSIKLISNKLREEEFISCPICFSQVKAKNLLLHFDRNHNKAAIFQ